MISKDEAMAEYSLACETLERAKIYGKPKHILERLQEAIDFWQPKMVAPDELTLCIEGVMRRYSEAKRRWDAT